MFASSSNRDATRRDCSAAGKLVRGAPERDHQTTRARHVDAPLDTACARPTEKRPLEIDLAHVQPVRYLTDSQLWIALQRRLDHRPGQLHRDRIASKAPQLA